MRYAFFRVKSKRTLKMCKMLTMFYDDRPEPAKRLEEARAARGFRTAKDATRFFGWKYETYIQHEQGVRGIGRQSKKYAAAFRISEGWLLTGEGTGPDGLGPLQAVPVRGFVGAGSTVHHYDSSHSPAEFAPIAPGVSMKTIALQIVGSSFGNVFNLWFVYYDNDRSLPTPDLFEKLCVVGLANGTVMVRELRKGTQPNRYHLLSQTEGMIEDAEVLWASAVKAMAPQ